MDAHPPQRPPLIAQLSAEEKRRLYEWHAKRKEPEKLRKAIGPHPFFPLTAGTWWKYEVYSVRGGPAQTSSLKKTVLRKEGSDNGHISYAVEINWIIDGKEHKSEAKYEVQNGWLLCTGSGEKTYQVPEKILPIEANAGYTWDYRKGEGEFEHHCQITQDKVKSINKLVVIRSEPGGAVTETYTRGVGLTERTLPDTSDSRMKGGHRYEHWRLVDSHISEK